MTLRRRQRNDRIKEEIRTLQASGLKIKDAVPIVADKFSLSESRILDIWYSKKVNSNAKTGGTKIKSYLAPALILLTVLADQCFPRL